jgi:hypothetical protein
MNDELTDRLRGKYQIGPHMPNGDPEFGWNQFEAPPIQHEAATEIERLRDQIEKFWVGAITEYDLYQSKDKEFKHE